MACRESHSAQYRVCKSGDAIEDELARELSIQRCRWDERMEVKLNGDTASIVTAQVDEAESINKK
jgi:hypothetical protein